MVKKVKVFYNDTASTVKPVTGILISEDMERVVIQEEDKIVEIPKSRIIRIERDFIGKKG